jgi:hypothetical protein
LLFVSPYQLCRNVLRIGRAAAISAKQNLIAGAEGLADKATRCINLAKSGVEQCLYNLQMLFEGMGQQSRAGILGCQGIICHYEARCAKFDKNLRNSTACRLLLASNKIFELEISIVCDDTKG